MAAWKSYIVPSSMIDSKQLLQAQRMIPTPEDIARRTEAWTVLISMILGESFHHINCNGLESYTSTVQGVALVVAPVGSYGLDVWDTSSDVRCMIAGTPSESSFFSLTRAKLRNARGQGVILLKANKLALNMFEVGISGSRFILQYHQSIYAKSWSEVPYLPIAKNVPSLSLMANRKLNAYRDTLYLRQSILDYELFQLSVRIIKLWSIRYGLHSTRMGYLDEAQIVIMVATICEEIQHHQSLSAYDVVLKFFAYYSTFDFEHEVVYCKALHPQGPPERRFFGPGLVILTSYDPVVDVASSTNKNSVAIVQENLRAAHATLEDGDWHSLLSEQDPSVGVGRTGSLSIRLSNFPSFPAYIRINVSFWGLSGLKAGRFVDSIEKELPGLVKDLLKSVPNIQVRAWPVRFKESQEAEEANFESYYKVFYVLGVAPAAADTLAIGDILQTQTDGFIDRLRSDSSYDARISWLGASLEHNIHIDDLQQDEKDWGLIPDEEKPDDTDDEDDSSPSRTIYETTRTQKSRNNSEVGAKPTKSQKKESASTTSGVPNTALLRMSLDILHRINHDPNIDSEDYIIGYEDRHVGIKEVPVAWWITDDQTRDDFIPQSRILYFRRKYDGVKVWERKTKIDLIFGSGTGDGTK